MVGKQMRIAGLVLGMGMAFNACFPEVPFYCSVNGECARGDMGGSQCLQAPDGNHYCAWPDTACVPTAFRWDKSARSIFASQCLTSAENADASVADLMSEGD